MLTDGPLSFLTDANVPDSVGNVLIARGHLVSRVRDIMAADSPDPIVAVAAIENGMILVSWDKDFNHQRFRQPRFAALSRIGMSGPEPKGAARIQDVIDLVEFAFARAQGLPQRLLIGPDKFMIRG